MISATPDTPISPKLQRRLERLAQSLADYYALTAEEGPPGAEFVRLYADPTQGAQLEGLLIVLPTGPDAVEYLDACERVCERLFDQIKQWQQLEADARANQSH